MIVHTDLRTNLKALSNFNPVADYPRQQSVLEAEFCSLDELRVVKTTQGQKSNANVPVYGNMILAANAYGRITIDDQSMQMIIKPLGAGQDALNQRQTMGWKGRLGGVLLDDSWAICLNSTLP